MADSRLWASLPLEESTRATPPGWRPGIAGYSFKKYQDKLNLWWRTRSVESDETAARLVMQRLQKGALKRAMQFKLIREGREYIGDNAIALPEVVANEQTSTEASPSGLASFMISLQRAYGIHEQDEVGIALDQFFGFRPEGRTLQDLITEFELAYDKANTKADLEINEVGLSHLLLAVTGVSRKVCNDLLPKVNGDLRRFNELKDHLMRMAKSDMLHDGIPSFGMPSCNGWHGHLAYRRRVHTFRMSICDS